MLPQHIQESLQELNIDVPGCRRLLLVDDEPENLEVLEALLEDDWEVFTARDGEHALEVMGSMDDVDLVIADQRMPRMTGVELLARVAEESPETVRIVLTAYSDVEPMLEAINRGSVYRFLLKPFDSSEIRSIVEDAMRLKSTTTALRQMVTALVDRREAMDKTLKMLDQTQQKLLSSERKATLGRVTAGIVHDLGNLSASLSYLTESLRGATSDPEPLRCADDASASLNSLLEMLRQIRNLARSAEVQARREEVDAASFVEQTVQIFHTEGISGRTRVNVDLDQRIQQLQIDAGLIRQALMALLRNAARAGGEDAQIDLRLEPTALGTDIRIDVSDKGCGMDQETMTRAHQPFFSGFEPAGPGLGLEIARLNTEAHGGMLKLASSPGQGTTATLLLPNVVVTQGGGK